LALAHDLELDLGVLRPAHLLDRLVKGEPLYRLVIKVRDDVVGHDPGLGGRRVIDRGYDLDQAVLHGDLDPKPAELAAGLHLQVVEAFEIHVARMRIEPGQHTVDRRFDELAVVGLFDIVRPRALEYVAEQAQLPVGIGGSGLCAPPIECDAGRVSDQRHSYACRRPEQNQASFAHHHPRTFCLHLRPTMGLDRRLSRLACTAGFGNGRESDIYNSIRESEMRGVLEKYVGGDGSIVTAFAGVTVRACRVYPSPRHLPVLEQCARGARVSARTLELRNLVANYLFEGSHRSRRASQIPSEVAMSACELQLGFRLGCCASRLEGCGREASRLGLAIGQGSGGPAQRGSAAEKGIPSFGQLSDQRADDVAIVVAPHPLVWVSCLGRPLRRLCEAPEILPTARNRGNRAAELVLFVGIRLVAQKRHEPVRCGDACDH
jgi:hypothetical protein